jgi:hypothetical protein
MTREQFQKMCVEMEARGLIKRSGMRGGEIVWQLTEAGARSGLPTPTQNRRSVSARTRR